MARQTIVFAEKLYFDTFPPDEVRLPMQQWLRHHGIDPDDVCVSPGWIQRDPGHRRIQYLAYQRDEHGKILLNQDRSVLHLVRTVQLEAVPSPFPAYG